MTPPTLPHAGVRPLYNQYHAVLLGDVGFTEGSRKPATGMLAWQFLKLVELYGLLGPGAAAAAAAGEGARAGPSEVARQAVKAARAAVGAARGASGGGTGAQAAEAAGGGKLQFAAFVRALSLLAGRKVGCMHGGGMVVEAWRVARGTAQRAGGRAARRQHGMERHTPLINGCGLLCAHTGTGTLTHPQLLQPFWAPRDEADHRTPSVPVLPCAVLADEQS